MLSSIRKFSGSIYAKILLGIVIIPFVFWGMGPLAGGNKNIIVSIDKEKYSIEEFANFIQDFSASKKVSANEIDNLLMTFVGEKLIEIEVEDLHIKLSDSSLAKLIKVQKEFQRDDKFSRTEYEKFLIKRNITAATFEKYLAKNEKRNQLMDFIGGGVLPSTFFINAAYNKINQRRVVELVNLNNFLNKKINFTENEINSYFQNNKNQYLESHNSIKLLELNAKNLTETNEYNNIFFQKIDEIDDKLIEGNNFDNIIKEYNLTNPEVFTFDNKGNEINSKNISHLPLNLLNKILNLSENENSSLIESDEKYYIFEIFKKENFQKDLTDKKTYEDVVANLKKISKRKLVTDLISQINSGKFDKTNFDKFIKEENIIPKKITLKNQNDDKIVKKELLSQIYKFPAKKVIVVNDINFKENYLIYIDEVKNVTIEQNTDEYENYKNLAKIKMTNDLYNTFDNYIRNKYEIDINYEALKTVKNYFN